jgi:hypothetical protein
MGPHVYLCTNCWFVSKIHQIWNEFLYHLPWIAPRRNQRQTIVTGKRIGLNKPQ